MIHTPSYPIELADKIAPYYKEAREGNLSSAMQLAALTNHHEVQIIKTLIALGAPRKLYDKALLAEAEKMREAHHSQQGIDDMRKEFLRLEMGISELIKSNTFQTEVDGKSHEELLAMPELRWTALIKEASDNQPSNCHIRELMLTRRQAETGGAANIVDELLVAKIRRYIADIYEIYKHLPNDTQISKAA